MSITKITDHAGQAVARLVQQDRGKPNIEGLVSDMAAQWQGLEEALFQVLVERAIDTAVGVQLDAIGTIVVEPRDGRTDAIYRRHLRAKIRTNRSDGQVEDLIAIARLVLGTQDKEATTIEIEFQLPAAVALRVLGLAVDDDVAEVLIRFERLGVSAGVRILVESSPADDDDTFSFGLTTLANGAISSGAGTITVDSTAGFPATGQLVIDAGLAVEETVTYTASTSTSFVLSGTTADNHDDNAPVQLATGPGQGFGYCANTDLSGGILAGVSTIPVTSTAGFPATGSIYIDAGTADEELLEYSSIDATNFFTTTNTVNAHSGGAVVQFDGSIPGTGGEFARAEI